MVEMISTSPAFRHGGMRETLESRLIFALSFVVFLVGAVLGRLLPWRAPRMGKGRRSIFGDARSAASECVSFAFMS